MLESSNDGARLLTSHTWEERAWPLAKAHLGREFEIRPDRARAVVELTDGHRPRPRRR